MAIRHFFWIAGLVLLNSCASYKYHIMFKPTEGVEPEKVSREILTAEKNYTIQKNDLLGLDVYSNKGERLIDPIPELSNSGTLVDNDKEDEPKYLVDLKGTVRFPMVGEIHLEGLTLKQAEEILQKEYANYFKEPFVLLRYLNKRVVVLGAPGGQVIPLTSDNMKLVEVLALAKGLPNDSKAQSLRVIRGERVFEIDFSTIAGFREGNLTIEPNDVVYIEPIRRPSSEALRDYAGVLSILVSLTTLIAVISAL